MDFITFSLFLIGLCDSHRKTLSRKEEHSKSGDISQTKPGDISQTKPGDIGHPKPGDISQTKQGNISQTKQGNISQTKPGNISQTKPGDCNKLVDLSRANELSQSGVQSKLLDIRQTVTPKETLDRDQTVCLSMAGDSDLTMPENRRRLEDDDQTVGLTMSENHGVGDADQTVDLLTKSRPKRKLLLHEETR